MLLNYHERRICHLHKNIDSTSGIERILQHLRIKPMLATYIERPQDKARIPETSSVLSS